MKNSILLFRLAFLCILTMIFINRLSAQDGNTEQIIRDGLRIYYVVNPNDDTHPHPVAVSPNSHVFGGNPNMEHAQQLVRAIFGTGESNSSFRETLASHLRRSENPFALFLYNDINTLEDNVSAMWVNCINNGHFYACATVDDDHRYARVLHYGAHQLNNETLQQSMAGVLRLFTNSRGSSGWWDEITDASTERFEVCAPFAPNYEDFRRSVVQNSPEIRRGMISRSNPEYAEEVIDRRPSLREIHHTFQEAGTENGQEICLRGVMVRDNRRYVAIIRFEARDVHTFDADEEQEDSAENLLYPEETRQRMLRERQQRIVQNMGSNNLPPRGTGESGRLSHIQFMETLRGYRRAWNFYLNGSGSIDNVRSFGYTEFQRPGLERAVREMQSLERQPQWLKVRIFREKEYLLQQMDNNIQRIEQTLLNNE